MIFMHRKKSNCHASNELKIVYGEYHAEWGKSTHRGDESTGSVRGETATRGENAEPARSCCTQAAARHPVRVHSRDFHS